MAFNLDVFQEEQKEWAERNFGSSEDGTDALLGVSEEVGELCHAHLKGRQRIRYLPEQIRAKKLDAIGDIVVYLADYCNRENIPLSDAIETAWSQVKKRDWNKNRQALAQEK